MRKLSRQEKSEFWEMVSVLCLQISVVLVLNQFVSPAIDAIVPSIAPLWVLGLFVGLAIAAGLNSWRHSGEQSARKILRQSVKRSLS